VTEDERMEKDIPWKWKTEVVILVSDKIDLNLKNYKIGKRRLFIATKGSIHQEDATNKHAYNIKVPKYTRHNMSREF
jgi:hypothetical protein